MTYRDTPLFEPLMDVGTSDPLTGTEVKAPGFSAGCSSTGNYTPLLGSESSVLWNAHMQPCVARRLRLRIPQIPIPATTASLLDP